MMLLPLNLLSMRSERGCRRFADRIGGQSGKQFDQ